MSANSSSPPLEPPVSAPPLAWSMRARLSAMMFLQSAAPGAYAAVLGVRLSALGFTEPQISSIYATFAIGTLATPMVFGQLADRHFRSERLLGVLHLVNAMMLWLLSDLTAESQFLGLTGPHLFWGAALITALAFQPTWVMSYTVCFRHLPDAGRDMPGIRVMGTMSWMLANLVVGNALGENADATGRPLLLGATLSATLAVLAFTILPRTAPLGAASTGTTLPFVKALSLLTRPGFAVLLPVCLITAMASAFYFPFAAPFLHEMGYRDRAGTLAFGQFVELFFMPLIPLAIARLGLWTALGLGLACWSLRYALFVVGAAGLTAATPQGLWPQLVIIAAIALHGPVIALFREAALILIRLKTPDEIRGSATALYLSMTDGLGNLAGGWLSGYVVRHYQNPHGGHDWSAIWLVPGGVAALALTLYVIAFREPPDPTPAVAATSTTGHQSVPDSLSASNTTPSATSVFVSDSGHAPVRS